MECISVESLDGGGVKENLSNFHHFFFEGPSLKPNQNFIELNCVK